MLKQHEEKKTEAAAYVFAQGFVSSETKQKEFLEHAVRPVDIDRSRRRYIARISTNSFRPAVATVMEMAGVVQNELVYSDRLIDCLGSSNAISQLNNNIWNQFSTETTGLLLKRVEKILEKAVPPNDSGDLFASSVKLNMPSAEPFANVKPKLSSVLEFAPSKYLISIVELGISKFANELKPEIRSGALQEFLSDGHKSNRGQLIAKKLKNLISTIAFRQGDDLEPKLAMTVDGEFNSIYLSAFGDVFPFWPTDLPEFQSTLRSDLIKHLVQGGKYEGTWGKLVVENDELSTIYFENTVAKLGNGRPKTKAPRLPR